MGGMGKRKGRGMRNRHFSIIPEQVHGQPTDRVGAQDEGIRIPVDAAVEDRVARAVAGGCELERALGESRQLAFGIDGVDGQREFQGRLGQRGDGSGIVEAAGLLGQQKGLVFWISDFHLPLSLIEHGLNLMANHQMIPIVLWDPLEYQRLPRFGVRGHECEQVETAVRERQEAGAQSVGRFTARRLRSVLLMVGLLDQLSLSGSPCCQIDAPRQNVVTLATYARGMRRTMPRPTRPGTRPDSIQASTNPGRSSPPLRTRPSR